MILAASGTAAGVKECAWKLGTHRALERIALPTEATLVSTRIHVLEGVVFTRSLRVASIRFCVA